MKCFPVILAALTLSCLSFPSPCGAQDFPGDSERLVHLNIVYRHGDRAPIKLYPNDRNDPSFWTRGLGQLTKQGCRMHYKLGNYLRAHYSNFITGNPNEIHVQSSDKDRCLDSASCHLAGMYIPSMEQRFLPVFPWQPVPVHTKPNSEDGVLAPSHANCPNEDRAFEKLLQSPEAQEFIKRYSDFYQNLTIWSGERVSNWILAGHIYDVVMIERLYGLPVPEWAIEHFDELKYQQDQFFVWYAKTPELQRFRAGPLAKEIFENMKNVTQQPTDIRVHMYSTHDSEIASLLQLYGVFDKKSPRYCATLLVELWQDVASGNYSVKLFRLDYQDMEPQSLLQLSLGDFHKRIAPLLPDDWAVECGLRVNVSSIASVERLISAHRALAALVLLCAPLVLLLLLLSIVCFCCCCYRACRHRRNVDPHLSKKSKIIYQPLPTETIS